MYLGQLFFYPYILTYFDKLCKDTFFLFSNFSSCGTALISCYNTDLISYGLLSLAMCLSLGIPTVTLSSKVLFATEGDNVTLICNTTGIPPPSIEWTKVGDSTVLSSASVLNLYNIERSGTPSETVQYRCTASNGYGDQASALVTVHVYCE